MILKSQTDRCFLTHGSVTEPCLSHHGTCNSDRWVSFSHMEMGSTERLGTPQYTLPWVEYWVGETLPKVYLSYFQIQHKSCWIIVMKFVKPRIGCEFWKVQIWIWNWSMMSCFRFLVHLKFEIQNIPHRLHAALSVPLLPSEVWLIKALAIDG